MRYSFRAGRARISSRLQLSTCWDPGPHSPSPQETDMLTASGLCAANVGQERVLQWLIPAEES